MPLERSEAIASACDKGNRFFLSAATLQKNPELIDIYLVIRRNQDKWFAQYSPDERHFIGLNILRVASGEITDRDWQALFTGPRIEELVWLVRFRAQTSHFSPFPMVRIAEELQKLPDHKQDAYVQFIRNLSDSNQLYFGHFEAYLTSTAFFSMLLEVPDSQIERFFQNAFLANQYFEWCEKSNIPGQFSSDESRLFRFVQTHLSTLKSAKQHYISQKGGSIFEQLKTANAFPQIANDIDDLLGDNLSYLGHCRYSPDAGDLPDWLRPFDAIPSYVLHGVRDNFQKIKKDGILRCGGGTAISNTPKLNERNANFLFFGSPSGHHSRTGIGLELGPFRMYGDIVFEFPLQALSPTVRYTFKLKSKVFYSFQSRFTPNLSHDILDVAPVDVVASASTIFVANDDQKQEVSDWLTNRGNTREIPVLLHDQAAEHYRNRDRETAGRIRLFCSENEKLMADLAEFRADLFEYLEMMALQLASEDIQSPDFGQLKALVDELSGISFTDFHPNAKFRMG